jgi:hypothetical protein
MLAHEAERIERIVERQRRIVTRSYSAIWLLRMAETVSNPNGLSWIDYRQNQFYSA